MRFKLVYTLTFLRKHHCANWETQAILTISSRFVIFRKSYYFKFDEIIILCFKEHIEGKFVNKIFFWNNERVHIKKDINVPKRSSLPLHVGVCVVVRELYCTVDSHYFLECETSPLACKRQNDAFTLYCRCTELGEDSSTIATSFYLLLFPQVISLRRC